MYDQDRLTLAKQILQMVSWYRDKLYEHSLWMKALKSCKKMSKKA